MRSYQHQFEARIESIKYGRMFYGGVFLPDSILSVLPEARERGFRLAGEIGGLYGEFGLMAVKKSRYIVLSKGFLTEADLTEGVVVAVRFSPINPNHIDVPRELEEALGSNRDASASWSELTTGQKREFAHRIASAARESTRIKRVGQLIDELIDELIAAREPR